MRDVMLTAVGEDRPGIVAAVTGILFDMGCNLADCAMTLLGDQFAMILLIQVPEEVSANDLRAGLKENPVSRDLLTNIGEVRHQPTSPGLPHVVSIYGADRPGIVFRVSEALARKMINITDLTSHLVNGVYTMVLDVDVPDSLNPDEVQHDLQMVAGELGVDVTFRPVDSDPL